MLELAKYIVGYSGLTTPVRDRVPWRITEKGLRALLRVSVSYRGEGQGKQLQD